MSALTDLAKFGFGAWTGYEKTQSQNSALKSAIGAASPWNKYTDQYALKLKDLYQNPSTVENIPGYKQGLDTLTDNLNTQYSKTGYLNSGNRLLGNMELGQQYSADAFNKEAIRLMDLSGATWGNPGAAAQASMENVALEGNKYNMYGDLINKALGWLDNPITDAVTGGIFGSSGAGIFGSSKPWWDITSGPQTLSNVPGVDTVQGTLSNILPNGSSTIIGNMLGSSAPLGLADVGSLITNTLGNTSSWANILNGPMQGFGSSGAAAGSIGVGTALGIGALVLNAGPIMEGISNFIGMDMSDQEDENGYYLGQLGSTFKKDPAAGFSMLDMMITHSGHGEDGLNSSYRFYQDRAVWEAVEAGLIDARYPTFYSSNSATTTSTGRNGTYTRALNPLTLKVPEVKLDIVNPKTGQLYGSEDEYFRADLVDPVQRNYQLTAMAQTYGLTSQEIDEYKELVADYESSQKELYYDYAPPDPYGGSNKASDKAMNNYKLSAEALKSFQDARFTEENRKEWAAQTYAGYQAAGYTGDVSKLTDYLGIT